jgi:hypothetical protein
VLADIFHPPHYSEISADLVSYRQGSGPRPLGIKQRHGNALTFHVELPSRLERDNSWCRIAPKYSKDRLVGAYE